MGKPKYVYFSDELHAKLSKEENASALISRLLNDYYKQIEYNSQDDMQREVSISSDIEVRRQEIQKLEARRKVIVQDMETQKLNQLERSDDELKKYEEDKAKLKRKVELRYKFEEEMRKLGIVGDSIEWEKFYLKHNKDDGI